MEHLSLTDARAHLPQLLDRVAAGESFTITRRGADVAALVGHDKWMQTKTHDVILQAREVRRRIEAARGKAIDWSGPAADPTETDAIVTELQRSKGGYPSGRDE